MTTAGEPGGGARSFHSRITITPAGEVIFENLGEDLLEVARALDPDDPELLQRARLLERIQQKRQGEPSEADDEAK